jgi:hypothetical protein
VKAKGKRQKLKGEIGFVAFCLLPYSFTEAMALRPGITSGVPLSVTLKQQHGQFSSALAASQ